MRIGICTRYENHESTHMAVRFATLFTNELGADVSMLTMSQNHSSICKHWDQAVVDNAKVPFSKWAVDLTCIVWTTIPHVEQIRWARRQGKRTVIAVLWHEIETADDMHAMAAVDFVLCPHRSCYAYLKTAGLGNLICAAWDCGQPFHTKPIPYEITEPSILVPLWDGNARRSEMTLVHLLESLVRRYANLKVTVACNSSTMVTTAGRRLSRNPRIAVVRGTHPSTRFKLFQQHDLTLYPSQFESTGMTAIQSLELGTPLVAFGYRPMTELLTTTNSVMIPCDEELNDIGFPRAVPNYAAMEEGLCYLLNDPEYLRQLQGTTLLGLSQRREAFTSAVRHAVG